MSNLHVEFLGEIADLRAGFGFPTNLQGRRLGDYPFAKVGDISRASRSGQKCIAGADNYVDEGDLAVLKAKTVPPGSVLFAKIGEAIRQNHRVVADREMLIDNNAMAAVPRESVESEYLYRFLQTVDFYKFASSTTVPSLRKSELEKIRVPLPHLAEQRRIAAILDHADALRAKRREALARLDELTQSIFIDMFGSLNANECGWQTVNFGAVMLEGPQNGLYKPSSDYGSGVRILRIDGFHNSVPINPSSLKRVRIDGVEEKRYALNADDIIINRVNSIEHLGKSAVVPALNEVVVFESNMMRIRLNEDVISPTFCLAQLQSSFVRGQIVVAAKDAVNQSSINQTDVQSFQLRLPPVEQQQEYASRIGRLGVVADSHRAALAELDALFASLQSRAFRGEL